MICLSAFLSNAIGEPDARGLAISWPFWPFATSSLGAGAAAGALNLMPPDLAVHLRVPGYQLLQHTFGQQADHRWRLLRAGATIALPFLMPDGAFVDSDG